MLRSRAPVSVLHSREIHSGFALKVLPRRKAPARPILPFTVKERASNRVHLMSKVDCSSSLGLTNRSWLSQLPFRVRKGASASLLCCSYSAAVKGRRESTIASSSWSSAKRGPSLGSSGAAAICPARNMEGRSPAQAQIKMKQTTSVSRTQPAYAAPMMRLAASRSNSTCAHCTSMMAKMLKKEKYTLKSSNVMSGGSRLVTPHVACACGVACAVAGAIQGKRTTTLEAKRAYMEAWGWRPRRRTSARWQPAGGRY
mmetsp:Transcript_18404/g.69630  ORF Transcript_18404/g.69630 Transcript_18404/m.69630 type:complete len:256 (+) Transcript_18404:1193-1960(+)